MLRKAISMGFISVFAYIASYYSRSLLSVATPNMLQSGEYTTEFIGLLSSVQFLVYAAGQLVNGVVGDMINPKYMITIGLSVTGISLVLFPIVPFAWMQLVFFALMGAGLSMLRGPIMKMVSENLKKNHSRVVCTFLSAASFTGTLIASALAIAFHWDMMFIVAGIGVLVIAAVVFTVLSVFEYKGMLVFHSNRKAGVGGYLQLFKIDNFVFYMIVAGVVEISSSAIGFWVPTYLSDALMLDTVTTNVLFSIMSMTSTFAPFLAFFVFRLTKERDIAMLRCGFSISVVLFLSMIFVPNMWAKIVCLTLAKFSLACCSAVLWSIYIPGMGSTGKVSSINGVINCTGYVSAAVANVVFAKLLGLSWNGVILVWCGIAAVGLVAALVVRKKTVEN